MGVQRFEDLEIWREARELCRRVRDITSRGSFARDFKQRDQIRNASASIMDCIAEGFERGGNREFIHFLSIAKGSCGETRSQSYRAFDCDYIDRKTLDELIERTEKLSRKIFTFIEYLKDSDFRGIRFR